MATKMYSTPGVYIEEKNAFSRSVVPVPTAVPCFIGYTEKAIRNNVPVGKQLIKIQSLGDYITTFGGAPLTTYKVEVDPASHWQVSVSSKDKLFYLFNSIKLYFANGGGDCYIYSIGGYDTTQFKTADFTDALAALVNEPEPTLVVSPDAHKLEQSDYYTFWQEVLPHCKKMINRFAIFDVWGGGDAKNLATEKGQGLINSFKDGIGTRELAYGAVYWPWVQATVVESSDLDFNNIANFADVKTQLIAYTNMLYPKDGDKDNPKAIAINKFINNIPNGPTLSIDRIKKLPLVTTDEAKAKADLITSINKHLPLHDTDKLTAPNGQEITRDAIITAGNQVVAQLKDSGDIAQQLKAYEQLGAYKMGEKAINDAIFGENAPTLGLKKLAGTTEQIKKDEVVAIYNALKTERTDFPILKTQPDVESALDNLLSQNNATFFTSDNLTIVLDNSIFIKNSVNSLISEATSNNVQAAIINKVTTTALETRITELNKAVSHLRSQFPASTSGPKSDQAALLQLSPLYKIIMQRMRETANIIPASGAMAGVYKFVDDQVGTFKAPANISLTAVSKPLIIINNHDQESLNIPIDGKALNAIRTFPGKGTLIWGARTLDGNSQDWRYISVRRTVSMIELSVKYAAEAYVFEPNVSSTWTNINAMISNFLNNMWHQGALAGSTAAEAYSVSVGLGSTMTGDDILDGYMRIMVKVAITRPAEFIVITFQQQMQTS